MSEFMDEKERWQGDPPDDWLYDVEWGDEQDPADWWKPEFQKAWEKWDDEGLLASCCTEDCYDFWEENEEDEMAWMEHYWEHMRHDWWALGKTGRLKWNLFCERVGTSMKGLDLFDMVYSQAIGEEVRPPKTPAEAIKKGLLKPEKLRKDRAEAERHERETRGAWRRLKPFERTLWNELDRRIAIQQWINEVLPEEMVDLRPRRGGGYGLFRLALYHAKEKGKPVPPHPRQAYQDGFLSFVLQFTPGLLETLDRIGDNAWAIEYQKEHDLVNYIHRQRKIQEENIEKMKEMDREWEKEMREMEQEEEEGE